MLKTEIVQKFENHHFENVSIPIITIYNSPRDFVGKYVARLWNIDKPTKYAVLANSLAEIRECVPPQLTRLPRESGDDPFIVETWL